MNQTSLSRNGTQAVLETPHERMSDSLKNNHIHPLQARHQSVAEELGELWGAVKIRNINKSYTYMYGVLVTIIIIITSLFSHGCIHVHVHVHVDVCS